MSLRINPCLSSQHLNLHANLFKSLEDPVSRELMLKAVTLNPCGHDLNEDTAIQCLAYNKLCPLDRRPIEKYTPNYTIRHLAEIIASAPSEPEPPNQKAQEHLAKGEELFEQGDHEGAIQEFAKTLDICPTYEKAQNYLEFSLKLRCSSSRSSASSTTSTTSSPKILEKSFSNDSGKEKMIDLFLNLLKEPSVKSDQNLYKILEKWAEELMEQTSQDLTVQQQEIFNWAEKLVSDQKVRPFVAKKLQEIHSMAPSSTPTTTKVTTMETSLMPIHEAVKSGDLAKVKSTCLQFSYLMNQENQEGKIPLEIAIELGFVEITAWLCQQNPSLLHRTYNNSDTIFHLAAKTNHVKIMEWLTRRQSHSSIIFYQENETGRTLLDEAAQNDHLEMFKWLYCNDRSSLNARNNHHVSTYELIIKNDRLEILKWLFKFEMYYKNRREYVFNLAVKSNSLKITKWLGSEAPHLLIKIDDQGQIPLHKAAAEGHLEMVQWICSQFPELATLKDTQGNTPFHIAQTFKKTDVVNWLKENNFTD